MLDLFLDRWIEAARFAADVHSVMALRMVRLAMGGPEAVTESRNMVSEKLSAFVDSHTAAVTALLSAGNFEAITARAYGPYRRQVRANGRRLGRQSGSVRWTTNF